MFKVCARCGESKPKLDFPKKNGKCKPCNVIYKAEYHKVNAEALKKKARAWYEANKQRASDRAAEYRKENKERIQSRKKDYYDRNKDRIRTQASIKGKERRQNDPEYRSQETLRIQRYRERAGETYLVKSRIKSAEYRMRNPDKAAESSKRYRKENNHKTRYWKSVRRATKKQATPHWANDFVIKEIYELAVLRTKATGISWQVDHIVPLKSKLVCGLHCEANLQVIPSTDNIRKGNRWWPDMPTE